MDVSALPGGRKVDPGCHDEMASGDGVLAVTPADSGSTDADPFHIDTGLIPQASLEDNAAVELKCLGLDVFNQAEFEQGII